MQAVHVFVFFVMQAVARWALAGWVPLVAPALRAVSDDDELPEAIRSAALVRTGLVPTSYHTRSKQLNAVKAVKRDACGLASLQLAGRAAAECGGSGGDDGEADGYASGYEYSDGEPYGQEEVYDEPQADDGYDRPPALRRFEVSCVLFAVQGEQCCTLVSRAMCCAANGTVICTQLAYAA
jgi:hypothetical protein